MYEEPTRKFNYSQIIEDQDKFYVRWEKFILINTISRFYSLPNHDCRCSCTDIYSKQKISYIVSSLLGGKKPVLKVYKYF